MSRHRCEWPVCDCERELRRECMVAELNAIDRAEAGYDLQARGNDSSGGADLLRGAVQEVRPPVERQPEQADDAEVGAGSEQRSRVRNPHKREEIEWAWCHQELPEYQHEVCPRGLFAAISDLADECDGIEGLGSGVIAWRLRTILSASRPNQKKCFSALLAVASSLDARANWSKDSRDRDTPGTVELLRYAAAECKRAAAVIGGSDA